MPETYAHLTFGNKVLNNLESELRETVGKNLSIYQIGLHGPDIFYYYKPYYPNRVTRIARREHENEANLFFTKALSVIRCQLSREKATAYIAGCITHFMLDSICHPYISDKVGWGLSHSDIEIEFERMLMIKNGLDPFHYKPTVHLTIKEENAKLIAFFYDGITPGEIMESISTMKACLNRFIDLSPSSIKRHPLTACIPLIGYIKGRIMSQYPIRQCTDSNAVLWDFYQQTVQPTVIVIKNYFQLLDSDGELSPVFNRNYV